MPITNPYADAQTEVADRIAALKKKRLAMGIGVMHPSWKSPPPGSSQDRVGLEAAALKKQNPEYAHEASQINQSIAAGLPVKIGDNPEYRRPGPGPKRPPIFGIPDGSEGDGPPAAIQRTPPPKPTSSLVDPTATYAKTGSAMGGPDPAANERASISDQERLARLRNRRLVLLQSKSLAEFGGDNNARIAAIQDATQQLSHLEGSMRGPQPEMTADKATVGRNQLRAQLEKQGAAYSDQALGMYKAGDKGKMAEADALAAEGGRITRAAGERFPALDPEEAKAQADAANALRAKQLVRKQEMASLSTDDANREQGVIDRSRRLQESTGQLAESAIGAEVAKKNAEKSAAEIGGGLPAIAKAEQDAVIAEANKRRVLAQAAEKQTMAQSAADEKTMAVEAPLIDPGFVRVRKRALDTLKRFGGQSYLGTDRVHDVDQFIKDSEAIKGHIEALPPEQRDAVKNEVLSELGDAGLGNEAGFGQYFTMGLDLLNPGGLLNQGPKKRQILSKRYAAATRGLYQYLSGE